MAICFDSEKSKINRGKHGYELSAFQGFDAEPIPVAKPDKRFDYGEERFQAFGRINGAGHMIAYTLRGEDLWLVSFRRAHNKELRRYGI